MQPLSNIHTHSTFVDGRDTPEAMVGAALEKRFHTLGFSEHGHADYDECSMRPEQEAEYRGEILRLKRKYAGQIDILLGYEHDWLYPTADFSPYEYVIESVHYLHCGGEYLCVDNTRAILESAIDRHFGGDPYALCREYFRLICESAEKSRADVLGHIELVMKFNEKRDLFDDADPRYLEAALEAAECAARSGRLIEINTGAIARGYRTQPCPGARMLRRIREAGGRIIITSDCHDSAFLDCGFGDASALAGACGFKTAWMYRGGRLEEYALAD